MKPDVRARFAPMMPTDCNSINHVKRMYTFKQARTIKKVHARMHLECVLAPFKNKEPISHSRFVPMQNAETYLPCWTPAPICTMVYRAMRCGDHVTATTSKQTFGGDKARKHWKQISDDSLQRHAITPRPLDVSLHQLVLVFRATPK